MPRPADFTVRQQAVYDARRKVALAQCVLPPECADDEFQEIWYAHCWTQDRLKALSCPMDGLMAASNSIPMVGDPWPAAERIVALFAEVRA
jgi:hypothetical protein